MGEGGDEDDDEVDEQGGVAGGQARSSVDLRLRLSFQSHTCTQFLH